jgi:hypothetical protein
MIEITMAEATEIMTHVAKSQGGTFDASPTEIQIAALMGVVAIVKGLQEMGYRVSRPLKEVKTESV